MKLGTKINLMLMAVVAIVLTVAFGIIVNIESAKLRQQTANDATTITGILHADTERMLGQIYRQESYLQDVVDQISKTEDVKYVNVNDANDKYVATTDPALIGKKVKETDIPVIAEIKKKRAIIDIKSDEGDFFELEQHIPIFISAGDTQSKIINIIEVEVVTRSKNAPDVREAEKLLRVIVAGVEQSARAIILTYNDDRDALQQIAENVTKFSFFQDLVIFNNKLDIIANTKKDANEFDNDPVKYKQLREDVLMGKFPEMEVERVREGVSVVVRVMPINVYDEKTKSTKIVGIMEAHTIKESYASRVNELKMRMLGIGVILTAVLVMVLAIILRKEVVLPISRYSIIARKIADGDLSQTVESTSTDEIGQFGKVFNSMVGNLREIDKLKSDFISVAAHQLRTPLSGVKWVLKLLLDGDLGSVNDDQKGMLKRGYETNEKMIQLVNDLLNVSRIENGKFGYNFVKNDFSKLINILIENTVLPSKERNIEVRLENRIGEIPEFLFDPEKLLIALQNIVDNAMKYTLPGGNVTIVVERQGDYIQVKVSDTGVGIPRADIAKLFSKFFRAANVIHLQTDGSGLGLFIVKSIIMRHGGQIWVDSEEGKGTTLTVIIPVVAELLPKGEEGEGTGAQTKGGVGGTTAP